MSAELKLDGIHMTLFAADASTVIQITQAQGVIGIAIFIFGLGAAWATLKSSVKNIGVSVDKIESNLTKVQDSISNHRADITGLKAHTKYGIANSPVVPNNEGRRLLENSGFNTQYPLLKIQLFELIDQSKPRTLYDIELQSYKALYQLKNDPLIDPIKDYVVNHPDDSLDIILQIGSWIVRDDYAAANNIATKHTKNESS